MDSQEQQTMMVQDSKTWWWSTTIITRLTHRWVSSSPLHKSRFHQGYTSQICRTEMGFTNGRIGFTNRRSHSLSFFKAYLDYPNSSFDQYYNTIICGLCYTKLILLGSSSKVFPYYYYHFVTIKKILNKQSKVKAHTWTVKICPILRSGSSSKDQMKTPTYQSFVHRWPP